MIFPVKADLISLIEGIVESLQAFAKAHEVKLCLDTEIDYLEAEYQPEEIIADLTKLICRVITFTPQSNEVKVRIYYLETSQNTLHCTVSNTGANLSAYTEIISGYHSIVTTTEQSNTTTSFRLQLPLHLGNRPLNGSKVQNGNHAIILPYFAEIRKRLTSHFKSVKNLEQAASQKSDKEGIFLKKVNTIINSHLGDEQFKVPQLATAMALSKTQLFRKIKTLTQMPPARYIKYVRLQKAKALLETKDWNVSEVAYQVGFVSRSHFSRAFQDQFGFAPSTIKS